MTNKLPAFARNMDVAKEKMATALRESSAGAQTGALPEGHVWIQFSGKTGRWNMRVGQKPEPITKDHLWIVDISSFERGWVMWRSGSVGQKRFAPIDQAPVAVPDPEEGGPFHDDKDGWFPAMKFQMYEISTGVVGHFENNAKSGVSSIGELQGEIADRIEQGLAYYPVVVLGEEEFVSNGYTNYAPKFATDDGGWLYDAQIARLMVDDDGNAREAQEQLDIIDELFADASDGITGYTDGNVVEQAEAAAEAEAEAEEVEAEVVEAEVVEDVPETIDDTPKPRRRRASVATEEKPAGRRRRAKV